MSKISEYEVINMVKGAVTISLSNIDDCEIINKDDATLLFELFNKSIVDNNYVTGKLDTKMIHEEGLYKNQIMTLIMNEVSYSIRNKFAFDKQTILNEISSTKINIEKICQEDQKYEVKDNQNNKVNRKESVDRLRTLLYSIGFKGITDEEKQLVKFKIMVIDLWKKFGKYRSNNKRKNPLEILIGSKLNNEYAQIILDNSFSRSFAIGQCIWEDDEYDEYDISKLIDDCSECKDCSESYQWSCNLPNQIIFFSLLALSIDNELYNEKVNVISDFAYLVGFDSAMMKDWTNVVKKVLMAESINLDELETDKAKEYFKCLV